jgi:hypothetical protein
MTCSGAVHCETDACGQSCQTGNAMTGTNSAGACVMTVLGCFGERQPATAQDVSRYRAYVLESSLDSVLEESGVRAKDVQTVHERPAEIHELEWRGPFLTSDRELADPVHDITFAFYNRALHQITVSYARDRTGGHSQNPGTKLREREHARLDERQMARRTSSVALEGDDVERQTRARSRADRRAAPLADRQHRRAHDVSLNPAPRHAEQQHMPARICAP